MLHGVGKVVQQVSADAVFTHLMYIFCATTVYYIMQFNTDFLHSIFYLPLFRHVSGLAIGHLLKTCASFAPNCMVEILHM